MSTLEVREVVQYGIFIVHDDSTTRLIASFPPLFISREEAEGQLPVYERHLRETGRLTTRP